MVVAAVKGLIAMVVVVEVFAAVVFAAVVEARSMVVKVMVNFILSTVRLFSSFL